MGTLLGTVSGDARYVHVSLPLCDAIGNLAVGDRRTRVSHTQKQFGMQPFVQLTLGNFTYTSPPDPFSLYRLELYTPGGERADLLIYLSLSLLLQNEAVGWCVTHHTSIRWRMKI